MNIKQSLWFILEKYDCDHNKYFCDSISNFIQDKESSDDIINIFLFLNSLDKEDKVVIEKTMGSKINSVLFSF
jgi:hypothetical protein